MEPRGRMMLKVTGILYIVFAVLSMVGGLVAMLGGGLFALGGIEMCIRDSHRSLYERIREI